MDGPNEYPAQDGLVLQTSFKTVGKRQHITSLLFLRDIWYFPLGTSGTGIDFVFVHLYLVLALLSILGAFKASKYSGFEVFCLKDGIFDFDWLVQPRKVVLSIYL